MDIQVTDRGTDFLNSLSDTLHKETGAWHKITKTCSPQINEIVERFNTTLQEAIDSEQRDWDDLIDGILFAYRTSVHESTDKTPFSLMYGREPKMPENMEISPEFIDTKYLSMENKGIHPEETRTQTHQDKAKRIKFLKSRKRNYEAKRSLTVSRIPVCTSEKFI
jgi:hypothetical protein